MCDIITVIFIVTSLLVLLPGMSEELAPSCVRYPPNGTNPDFNGSVFEPNCTEI